MYLQKVKRCAEDCSDNLAIARCVISIASVVIYCKENATTWR